MVGGYGGVNDSVAVLASTPSGAQFALVQELNGTLSLQSFFHLNATVTGSPPTVSVTVETHATGTGGYDTTSAEISGTDLDTVVQVATSGKYNASGLYRRGGVGILNYASTVVYDTVALEEVFSSAPTVSPTSFPSGSPSVSPTLSPSTSPTAAPTLAEGAC